MKLQDDPLIMKNILNGVAKLSQRTPGWILADL